MNAKCSQGFPKFWGKELAERRGWTGRVGGRVRKGERSKETDGRIQKRENVGPSNVSARIRDSGGVGEDTLMEIISIVGAACWIPILTNLAPSLVVSSLVGMSKNH